MARRPVVLVAILLAGWAGTATSASAPAADAPNSPKPIHLHTVGSGNVEGLKKGIAFSVEACRVAKNLPAGAPIKMPSDTYLGKLAIAESDEYFDGARWATFSTSRLLWADPRSSCELKLFHERHAWVGQVCSGGVGGGTTALGDLVDLEHPVAPKVEISAEPGARRNCGRRASRYEVEGLPQEDAGLGARCAWQSDVIAKSMRQAGLPAQGHDPNSPAVDFCLYAGQPIYVFNGHHELVVLKSSGSAKDDVMDQLMGLDTAYLNSRLTEFSDGPPIPAERFSERALRTFLEQPAITSLGDSP